MADGGFEKDLERLEKIVEALETGGLSLDESLKQFEQGIKLARRCEKTLTEAEKRIEILTRKADGDLEAEPFDADEEEAAAEPKAKPSARKSAGDRAAEPRTEAPSRRVESDVDDLPEEEELF